MQRKVRVPGVRVRVWREGGRAERRRGGGREKRGKHHFSTIHKRKNLKADFAIGRSFPFIFNVFQLSMFLRGRDEHMRFSRAMMRTVSRVKNSQYRH